MRNKKTTKITARLNEPYGYSQRSAFIRGFRSIRVNHPS